MPRAARGTDTLRAFASAQAFVPPLLPLLLLSLAWAPAVDAGPTDNVIFHARLDEHSGYNDIWGYTAPGGAEYALLGTKTGLAVINVSDPDVPYETGFFPGATSIWRDIKTYDHYAYVVNESGGGLQIVDLVDPESPSLVGFYTGGGFNTAHNLFIDTATARAYVFGATTTDGFLLLDLTSPTAPVEIMRWNIVYLHDGMVQDGRLYACAINDRSLRVLDVSDPGNIIQLGTAEGYPRDFTHNAWVTKDGAYVMTTDELSSSSIRMWDLSTLPTLAQTDSYHPGPSVIPHNTHIEGDLAFISYYTLGLKILDVSNPFQLVEVGSYDTWPSDDASNYNGCWGVYPFLRTNPNLIVASDVENGLYVLEYKGELGTLSGQVAEVGAPATTISDATVEILQSGVSVVSDTSGNYTVQDLAGNVDVRVSAFGYHDSTIPAVIVTGVTTVLGVALDPVPRGSVAGHVTDRDTGAPIEGARVEVLGTPLLQWSDASGAFAYAAVPEGIHTVQVFAFGHTPMRAVVSVSNGVALMADFPLNPAQFSIDFEGSTTGWLVATTATAGDWEVADPQGTYSGGIPIQPEFDHTPAPGTKCWVTDARAGQGPGNWDVDNGATVLTTPNLSTWGLGDPHVRYSRWYSSGVGNPNTDPFLVEMSTNGGSTWPIVLENSDTTTNAWIQVDFALNAFAVPSSVIRFRFTAQDTGAGGIIEAALDDFMIYDGFDDADGTHAPLPVIVDRGLELSQAWPNPFGRGQELRAEFVLGRDGRVTASVFDVAGRRVATLLDRRLEAGSYAVIWPGKTNAGRESPGGVYFLRVRTSDVAYSRKVVLLR